MITVNLGDLEAVKILKSLKLVKTPVIKGLYDKIETQLFNLINPKFEEKEESYEKSI